MSLENHYSSILEQLGEDVSREGLRDTPKRAAKAMQFLGRGAAHALPAVTIDARFSSHIGGRVLVKTAERSSLDGPSTLPFGVKANGAFPMKGKVLGLSKVARIVDMY